MRRQSTTPIENSTLARVTPAIEGEMILRTDSEEVQFPDIGRELSKGERALLLVLMDPTHYRTSTAERARAAGISVSTYFRIMRQPDFQVLINAAYRTAMRQSLGHVIAAALDTATEPGRDGQRDREMVLQMTGLHAPRQGVEVNVGPGSIVGVVGVSVEDL
jgi:hypothetical protein